MAPVARSVKFASFGRFTAEVVGDLTEPHISARCGAPGERGDVSGAEPDTSASETAGGIGGDGQAGAEADEVADQVGVATDEAELATELLLSVGHVTRTPSPLPVREAAV
jgi:hypothetical protein